MRDIYTPKWTSLPNDPDYEAQATYEASIHTASARALYAKNERRLARARERARRAEEQHQAAKTKPGFSKREIAKLWVAVERRYEELRRIEREMTAVAAGAQHRGRGSHRPAPPSDSSL